MPNPTHPADQLLDDIAGVLIDRGWPSCPYLNRNEPGGDPHGTCDQGWRDEPACETNGPYLDPETTRVLSDALEALRLSEQRNREVEESLDNHHDVECVVCGSTWCESAMYELPTSVGADSEDIGYSFMCPICWGAQEADVPALERERDAYKERAEKAEAAKDGAYHERDQLVAVLSKVWPSHLVRHDPDQDWGAEWRTIVCVHTPAGQATWHIHESEVPLFPHLVLREDDWDGHTTEEKYDRLAALADTEAGS